MQEQILSVGDYDANCAVGPDNGPPLVLFHGVTRCWQDFEPLLPGLSGCFHVFAPDHRGHGGSKWGRSEYRIVDFVDDAVAYLDAHVPRPTILLGHSLGALVAAMVAARRPSRILSLIMEDPPGSTLGERFQQSRFCLQFTNTLRLLQSTTDLESLITKLTLMEVQRPSDGVIVPFGTLRDSKAIRFGAECLLRVEPKVLSTLTAGRWLEGLDWFGALPHIQCPTLLLRADPQCGGMLDAREADRIISLIPRCSRIDLPGIGHSIHSAQPDEMLTFIFDFLIQHNLLPTNRSRFSIFV